jgi:hypothetical protein
MITVFRASSVPEADIVAAWLDDQGIGTFVKNRLTAETLPLPNVVAPRGFEVCVAERDVERAKWLLDEHQKELARRRQADDASPVHGVCETCRHVTPFPHSQAGTTQHCTHCGSYIEVPEL